MESIHTAKDRAPREARGSESAHKLGCSGSSWPFLVSHLHAPTWEVVPTPSDPTIWLALDLHASFKTQSTVLVFSRQNLHNLPSKIVKQMFDFVHPMIRHPKGRKEGRKEKIQSWDEKALRKVKVRYSCENVGAKCWIWSPRNVWYELSFLFSTPLPQPGHTDTGSNRWFRMWWRREKVCLVFWKRVLFFF